MAGCNGMEDDEKVKNSGVLRKIPLVLLGLKKEFLGVGFENEEMMGWDGIVSPNP
jgi:hypothetical protein